MSNSEIRPGKIYHAASEKCKAATFVIYSGSSTPDEKEVADTIFQADGSLASQLVGLGIAIREKYQGKDVLIYTHMMDDQINWPDYMGNDYDDSFEEGDDSDGL